LNEAKTETLTEKITIEIHRIGESVAPYLPKYILKSIPATAKKLKDMQREPWLVDFSIRRENGRTVLVLEAHDEEKEVKQT
jgi:hypothetical protein